MSPYCPGVRWSSGLQDLIDRAAFLSTEHQQDMSDAIELAPWNVDLMDQSFVFHTDPPTTLSCNFLGTTSLDAGSWLWGWKNINGFPDAAVELATAVRRYGEEHGVPELTTEETPLDEDTALDIGHRLTLAAKAVSGKYAHYSCPSSDRSRRTWLLLDGPAVGLSGPSVIRIPRVITETLDQGVLADSHKALRSYAQLRGIDIRWERDDLAHLAAPDGEMTVAFDDLGRISRMNLHAQSPTSVGEKPKRRGIRGVFGRRRDS